jgi:alkylation response protein AidB-like acyl-CoA dehydrogenase
LNIGRIKLGGGVLGGCKGVIDDSINYSNERTQFGRPISKYGMIKEKLAKMAIHSYVLESAVYRATQNIDDAIAGLVAGGMEKGEATLKGIASFAPECAILKVAGSEVLDYTVDEGVQIHGGMGYSAETRIETSYRDARINRIFEGTNEINRMLTVDMLLKKAMKGELDLMGPAMAVASELTSIPDFGGMPANVFEEYTGYVANFKKIVLMIAGAAAQKFAMSLAKEQEILGNIADVAIQTYLAESVLLRVQKLANIKGGEDAVKDEIRMMKSFFYEAVEEIQSSGKSALWSFAEGDEFRGMTMGLKRFTKMKPFNVKE